MEDSVDFMFSYFITFFNRFRFVISINNTVSNGLSISVKIIYCINEIFVQQEGQAKTAFLSTRFG